MAGKPLRRNVMFSSKVRQPPGVGSSDDLKGLDILLVEDSLAVSEAVKSLLKLLGADVAGPAANRAEAERLLSEHTPDVALVDFHLRGGELAYGLIDPYRVYVSGVCRTRSHHVALDRSTGGAA